MTTRIITICKIGDHYNFKDNQGGEKNIPGEQYAYLEDIAWKYQDAGYAVQIRRDWAGDKILKVFQYDKPARLDVLKSGQAWAMYEYPEGWDVDTPPTKVYHVETLDQVRAKLDELEAQGYTVFSWELPSNTGFRAMDRVRSVRTGSEIHKLRNKFPAAFVDFATAG